MTALLAVRAASIFTGANGVAWAFLSACAALIVLLIALGVALVLYQRRFVSVHRLYADGLVRAQEEERAWVAREVHDDALQRIMMLVHELDGWHEHANGDAARIEALRGELEDLSASLRRMAYRLHPSFLREMGVVAMVQQFANEIRQVGGLQVEVRSPATPFPPLAAEQSLVIYRIVQEALSNVRRHAGSARAVVEFGARGTTIEVRIEDYGAGFDQARPPRRGLGLTSMTERARAAGGLLSIESYPGGGTRVHLKLPAGRA
jgi:two-component system sensor histidine kinase NreB